MARDPHTLRLEPLTLANIGGPKLMEQVDASIAEIAALFASGEFKDGASAKLRVTIGFKHDTNTGIVGVTAGVTKTMPAHPPVKTFALLRGAELVIEPDQGHQLDLIEGDAVAQFSRRSAAPNQE